MLKYKKVRWKNLLSTGNSFIEVDLTKHAQTLVIGKNGAGKSLFMDAICYGLFGKPFREIKIGQLINSVNKKSMVVEVEFEVDGNDYKVIRGISPKKFEIYKNDNLVKIDGSALDYQNYLEKEVIQRNQKTFAQVEVIGSATFTPFMKLKPDARRAVVEDIIDIQIFSKMKKIAVANLRQVKDEIKDKSQEIAIVAERIKTSEKYINQAEKNSEKEISTIKDQIDKQNSNIDLINSGILKITDNISDINIPDTKELYTMLEKYSDSVKYFQRSIEQENQAIEDVSHDDCPLCRQKITHEHKDDIISYSNSRIEGFQFKIDKADKRLSMIKQKIKEVDEDISKVNELKETLRQAKNKKENTNSKIEYLEKQLSDLQQKTQTSVDYGELKKDKDVILRLNEEMSVLEEKQDDIKTSQKLLDDDGIKAHIVKRYIPKINQYINLFLERMDFHCQFTLDEEFNETMKSRYLDEFSYFSFSEGEKMKINLAILFAWRAISAERNSVSSNLLILDEVMDSSLEGEAVEEFLRYVNTLTGSTNIIIISHRSESLDGFDSMIEVSKVKGFTEYKEV